MPEEKEGFLITVYKDVKGGAKFAIWVIVIVVLLLLWLVVAILKGIGQAFTWIFEVLIGEYIVGALEWLVVHVLWAVFILLVPVIYPYMFLNSLHYFPITRPQYYFLVFWDSDRHWIDVNPSELVLIVIGFAVLGIIVFMFLNAYWIRKQKPFRERFVINYLFLGPFYGAFAILFFLADILYTFGYRIYKGKMPDEPAVLRKMKPFFFKTEKHP